MSSKDKKPSMANSPTGTLQRPNLEDLKRRFEESSQPPVLSAADQDESITGVISLKNLRSEGDDGAKEDDDSPTKSATTV